MSRHGSANPKSLAGLGRRRNVAVRNLRGGKRIQLKIHKKHILPYSSQSNRRPRAQRMTPRIWCLNRASSEGGIGFSSLDGGVLELRPAGLISPSAVTG